MIVFTGARRFSPFALSWIAALLLLGWSAEAHAQAPFALLHTFDGAPNDGAVPYEGRGLVQGVDGMLYGTTRQGGSAGFGTVFRIAPDGTCFTILHNFLGAPIDGANPFVGLTQGVDGTLYGTTYSGGSGGLGTIFQIANDGSGYTLLHSFVDAETEGRNPRASLVQGADGTLFGTSELGGGANLGTVFQISPDGTGFMVMHSFTGAPMMDGAFPTASLIQGSDGLLYGTTYAGGSANLGTIFQMAPDASTFTLLHSFTGGLTDGQHPQAGLIQGVDGTLYGTTVEGGNAGCFFPFPTTCGTVYEMAPDGGGFALIHTFTHGHTDGWLPIAGLIRDANDTLYGTTVYGGSSDLGTVFQLTPDGSFTLLHNFTFAPTDGNSPFAALMQDSGGVLYGTTGAGGPRQFGVLFALSSAPSGSPATPTRRTSTPFVAGGNRNRP